MNQKTTKGPNDYGQDGVDHINVSHDAHTHLGRLLDPTYVKVFEYPYIGKFCSVRALWGWLTHFPTDDSYRRAGKKEMARLFSYQTDTTVYVPNFIAIIAYATWLKLVDDKKAMEDFKRLYKEKDFLSYTIPARCVVRVKNGHSDLLMSCLAAIAKSLEKGGEPDFSELCKHPNSRGYFYLEAYLKKTLSAEVLKSIGIKP